MSGAPADIRVGDIVSRCGDDRLQVVRTNARDGLLPDLVFTICLDAGQGWGGFVVGEEDSLCADDVKLLEREPTREAMVEFAAELGAGERLDRIAEMYGVRPREDDEPDADFRPRVLEAMIPATADMEELERMARYPGESQREGETTEQFRDRLVGKTHAYLLYEEVSDQYGTSKVVGVFTTRPQAIGAMETIRDRRTFIQEWPLGQLDRSRR